GDGGRALGQRRPLRCGLTTRSGVSSSAFPASIVHVLDRGKVQRYRAAVTAAACQMPLDPLTRRMERIDPDGAGYRRGARTRAAQLAVQLVEPAQMSERPRYRTDDAA